MSAPLGPIDPAAPVDRDPGGRAEESAWASAITGLPKAITVLDDEVGDDQLHLVQRAEEVAQPGLVDPRRLARHAAAASISRAVRITTQIPEIITTRRPLNDPRGWAKDAAIEALVDQLVLGGPAAAELARLITASGSLFPESLRIELDRRDPMPLPIPANVVQALLDKATDIRPGDATPLEIDGPPITRTAVSQVHLATTDAGEPLLARVRRPRIAWELDHDAKLTASIATALQRLAPDVGGMGPTGFVQLTMRQTLESTDLRFEAINLVELGMVVEELALPGLSVARPVPVRMTERALTLEHREGVALTEGATVAPEALRALVGITLESALVHGVFWADPAPEHLLVGPDGNLVLVGIGTLGRFNPALQLAGVRTLKGVLTGDHAGLLEGMAIAGALTADVDTDELIAELASIEALNPMAILTGGEDALLDALSSMVGTMLANKLQPPIEVILLVRTLFSLGRLLRVVWPDGPGLSGALMELLPRLPQLIADAEHAAGLD